ncbi:MAG TPA: hypothetical protein VEF04_08305, partial [Blastocatellia bacterium]|nr:hypothetical protein [Blastocatellia bacterium]
MHQNIVTIVQRREPQVDFQTAFAAGLPARSDPFVLLYGADTGRVIVSHDQSTMPRYFATFIQEQQSPGLIIVPQHHAPIQIADELLLLWHASEAEE